MVPKRSESIILALKKLQSYMESERLAYENKGQEKPEGENHGACLLCRGAVWRRGEANSVQNG